MPTFQNVDVDPETSFREDRPLSEDRVRPPAAIRRGVRTMSLSLRRPVRGEGELSAFLHTSPSESPMSAGAGPRSPHPVHLPGLLGSASPRPPARLVDSAMPSTLPALLCLGEFLRGQDVGFRVQGPGGAPRLIVPIFQDCI